MFGVSRRWLTRNTCWHRPTKNSQPEVLVPIMRPAAPFAAHTETTSRYVARVNVRSFNIGRPITGLPGTKNLATVDNWGQLVVAHARTHTGKNSSTDDKKVDGNVRHVAELIYNDTRNSRPIESSTVKTAGTAHTFPFPLLFHTFSLR